MDPPPGPGESGDRSLGLPSDRPVCNQPQQTTPGIRITDTGTSGLGSRRSIHLVDKSVGLCISPSTPPDQGVAKSPRIHRLHPDPDSTSLASTAVVPSAPVIADRHPQGSPPLGQNPVAPPGQNLSPGPRPLPPDRLESIRRHLCTTGFSAEVAGRIAAPQRPSSLRTYQNKWAAFHRWCQGRCVDPHHCDIAVIAEFLSSKFKEGSRPATVANYRSAISATRAPLGTWNQAWTPLLSQLLKNMAIERPVADKSVPQWDLSLVLRYLKSSSFEPLASCALPELSYKTVFLVLMASGLRRGEVHAFQYNRTLIERDRFILRTAPGFLAKNQLPSSQFPPVPILAMPKAADGSLEDTSLCPYRALSLYLEKTRNPLVRKGRKRLFVSVKPSFEREICADTISSWVRRVIVGAYNWAAEVTPESSRPHELRALAHSLSAANKLSLSSIMETGRWRSHNTFTSFYLRDMVPQLDGLFSLGPIVAAQNCIRPVIRDDCSH